MAKPLKRQNELWEAAISKIDDRYSKWMDYWTTYHQWCRLVFRLYLARNEWTSIGRRARLTLSLPFSIIETVAAETYRALYDEQPYFKQKPIGKEDEEFAESVSLYTAHQMDQNHMRIKGYIFEKNRLMFGLSWAFVPWTVAREWKRRESQVMQPAKRYILDSKGQPVFNDDGMPKSEDIINPMTGKPIMQPKMDMFTGRPVTEKKFVKEVTKDYWEFKPLYPWQVIADPAITDPFQVQSGGEGIIINQYLSNSELWKLQRDGVYYNVDEYFDTKEEDSEDNDRQTFDVPREDEDLAEDMKEGYSYKRNLNLVRQWWGKMSVREDKNGNLIYDKNAEPVEVIVDKVNNTCLRCRRNVIDEQIRPIVAAQCHPIADHLISPGLLQAVESELRELQTFKTARVDNITQKMNPMYQVRDGSLLAKRDLRYRPFGLVPVSAIDQDLKEFPTPDIVVQADRSVGELEYSIQNATNALSASQNASNVGQAFGKTARGIDFFQNRMMSRLKVIVDVGEEQLFSQLSDITNSYNKQFLTKQTDFQVIGRQNPYLKITPEAYMNRRDMLPIGASRKLSRGQMLQIYDRILTSPEALKGFIKIDYLVKEMIKLTDAFPDPEKLLYTDEERQKMAAETPPDVKKAMNISVNFADLNEQEKVYLMTRLLKENPEELQSPQAQLPPGIPAQVVNG